MIIQTIFEYSNSKIEKRKENFPMKQGYTNLLEVVSGNVNHLLKQHNLVLQK